MSMNNPEKLQKAIEIEWGLHSSHAKMYRDVLDKISSLESEIERLKKEKHETHEVLKVVSRELELWKDKCKDFPHLKAEIKRLKASSEKTGLAIALCEHGKEWTKEYYECEHDSIMYSHRDPQKALIVDPELREWLTNVMSHLEEMYNDNTYEIVEIKVFQEEKKEECKGIDEEFLKKINQMIKNFNKE